MKITIQKAKNGEDTATADGHFLHSNYAPVKEAQRFVENLPEDKIVEFAKSDEFVTYKKLFNELGLS